MEALVSSFQSRLALDSMVASKAHVALQEDRDMRTQSIIPQTCPG